MVISHSYFYFALLKYEIFTENNQFRFSDLSYDVFLIRVKNHLIRKTHYFQKECKDGDTRKHFKKFRDNILLSA
jgi:hypothetical protein